MTLRPRTNGSGGTEGDGRAGAVALFGRVAQALDAIHAAYQELDALSRSQDELIEGDRGEELLELLERRQVLVERLGALDREFVPLRRAWDERSGACAPAQREHVAELLAAIGGLARSVGSRDAASTQRLQLRRDALAGELAGLGRSRSAQAAYGPRPGGEGPRFQDREG